MLYFVQVSSASQIQTVSDLAFEIWNQHYVELIGQKQVDYMLTQFQTATAIREQIQNGYLYYLICKDNLEIGYFAILFAYPEKSVHLSKIYLKKEYRNHKLGKKYLEFIENLSRELGGNKIWLTVNKYNSTSIATYESFGFIRKYSLMQEIGRGYVMDDYYYEKELLN